MDFLGSAVKATELAQKKIQLKNEKKNKMEELMYQYNGYARNFLLCTKYNSYNFETEKKYDFDNAIHYFLKMNCMFPRLELFSNHTTKYAQNHLSASELYLKALINGTYEELDKGIQKDGGNHYSLEFFSLFDENDIKERINKVVKTTRIVNAYKFDTGEEYIRSEEKYHVNGDLLESIQHWQLLDILKNKIFNHMKLDIEKI